jgi:hypothetical protein
MHYSLESYFFPLVSFSIRPTSPSRIHQTSDTLGRYILLLLVIPLLISFGFIYRLDTNVRHIGHYLERSSLGYDRWNELPELITVTTTVSPGITSKWWFVGAEGGSTESGASTATGVSDDQSSRQYTPSSIPSYSPSSSASQGLALRSSEVISPFAKVAQSLAVLPEKLAEVSWEDLRPLATGVIDSVGHVLGRVWQAFRRIYHYPLEPA